MFDMFKGMAKMASIYIDETVYEDDDDEMLEDDMDEEDEEDEDFD